MTLLRFCQEKVNLISPHMHILFQKIGTEVILDSQTSCRNSTGCFLSLLPNLLSCSCRTQPGTFTRTKELALAQHSELDVRGVTGIRHTSHYCPVSLPGPSLKSHINYTLLPHPSRSPPVRDRSPQTALSLPYSTMLQLSSWDFGGTLASCFTDASRWSSVMFPPDEA